MSSECCCDDWNAMCVYVFITNGTLMQDSTPKSHRHINFECLEIIEWTPLATCIWYRPVENIQTHGRVLPSDSNGLSVILDDHHRIMSMMTMAKQWPEKAEEMWIGKIRKTFFFPFPIYFFKHWWVVENVEENAENGQLVVLDRRRKKGNWEWEGIRTFVSIDWIEIFSQQTNPQFHLLFGYTIRPL